MGALKEVPAHIELFFPGCGVRRWACPPRAPTVVEMRLLLASLCAAFAAAEPVERDPDPPVGECL